MCWSSWHAPSPYPSLCNLPTAARQLRRCFPTAYCGMALNIKGTDDHVPKAHLLQLTLLKLVVARRRLFAAIDRCCSPISSRGSPAERAPAEEGLSPELPAGKPAGCPVGPCVEICEWKCHSEMRDIPTATQMLMAMAACRACSVSSACHDAAMFVAVGFGRLRARHPCVHYSEPDHTR